MAKERLERILSIRAAALALSPEYLLWLDGDDDDLEPLLSPELRERMRALLAREGRDS